MRANRRLVLTDRFIPFLSAFVGLVALGGAVLVQLNADQRTRRMAEELVALRQSVEALRLQVAAPAAPAMDQQAIEAANGTVDALLALQERMDKLETAWAEAPAAATSGPALPGNPASNAFSASPDRQASDIDPSWPTTDCIPLGTRFMASLGDELAICQSPVVVKVQAITDDNVMIADVGVITETAFRSIPGSNCQLTVYTADGEGFAEMRVSCL